MSAKPLGFYGLSVGTEAEEAIDLLPLHFLTELMDDMISDLNLKHYWAIDGLAIIEPTDMPISPRELKDIDKIGLIRGLCDRIELKLMETAN